LSYLLAFNLFLCFWKGGRQRWREERGRNREIEREEEKTNGETKKIVDWCCLTLRYLFRFWDFGKHQSTLKSTLICLAIDGKQWNCIMNDGTMLLCQELNHMMWYSYHFYLVSAIEGEDKCFHFKKEPLHQTWVLHINSFCAFALFVNRIFFFFGEVSLD